MSDNPHSSDPQSTLSTRTRLRILRMHAAGGLGQVAIALDEGLGREIAFKEILPKYADVADVRARFLREAEITGGLEHPGIVPVYGVGQYDNGRPFYVMRLIQGDSLRDAVEGFFAAETVGRDPGERRLALHKMLGRFIDVCHAVGYAHSRGVLHRDLKPGNIMLGEYGETLVVDWGLAKATGHAEQATGKEEELLPPSLSGTSSETRHGSSLGTPAYMSPEQAVGKIDLLGPATDIYALGSTLYTILTGRPPIEGTDLDEMLAKVLSGTFPRPREVNRTIPKPLEAICLKAMANDPADRYKSAAALASDIEHYLADERVSAHQENWIERAARWGRRYKTLARAAAVSLVVIAAISIGFAIVADRLRSRAVEAESKTRIALDDRTEALEAKTVALAKEQAARKEANEVRERFISAFRSPAPERDGRDVKVVDVLDRFTGELKQDSDMSPTLRASLVSAIGNTYSALGRYQEALPLHEEAMELMKQHYDPSDDNTLMAMNNLASAYLNVGEYDRAIELFKQTLNLEKEAHGPDHRTTLMLMSNLAGAYRMAGKLDLVVPLLEETLKRMQSTMEPEDLRLLVMMSNLAEAYLGVGKLAQAVRLSEESTKRQGDTLGPDHPRTLASMNTLANAYSAVGEQDRAMQLFEDIYQKRKVVFGPDSPDTLMALGNLANEYWRAGKTDLAIPLFEETLELRKEKLGKDHASTLSAMNSLAVAYATIGKVDKALPIFEEAFALAKEKLGHDHPSTLTIMHSLATAYMNLDKVDDSLQLFEETLKLQEVKLGPNHPSTLGTRNNLASAYRKAGKLDEALQLSEETLQLRETALGPAHPDTLVSMGNTAWIYQEMGKLNQALPLYQETLKMRTEKLGPSHPDTLKSMWDVANTYEQLDQLDQAIPLYEEMLSRWKAKFGSEHPYTLLSMNQLASACFQKKDYAKAAELLRESYCIRQEHAPESWETFENAAFLGTTLSKLGQYADAEPLLVEGIEGLEQRIESIPPMQRNTIASRIEALVELYDSWDKPVEAAKWRTKLERLNEEPVPE